MQDKKELELRLKMDFIKKKFNFIGWEETFRHSPHTEGYQLVSQLLESQASNNSLLMIQEQLPPETRHTISRALSRNNNTKYRIVVQLDAFELPEKARNDNLLCAFLNEMRCPPSDLGHQENEGHFYFEWETNYDC